MCEGGGRRVLQEQRPKDVYFLLYFLSCSFFFWPMQPGALCCLRQANGLGLKGRKSARCPTSLRLIMPLAPSVAAGPSASRRSFQRRLRGRVARGTRRMAGPCGSDRISSGIFVFYGCKRNPGRRYKRGAGMACKEKGIETEKQARKKRKRNTSPSRESIRNPDAAPCPKDTSAQYTDPSPDAVP